MIERKRPQRMTLKLHPAQMKVLRSRARFKVVVAGRRWGKTTMARAAIIAMAKVKRRKIWYIAPTYRMAKGIMWIELLDTIPRKWIRKINETTLTIRLINGTVIELKGADKPDSLRGVGLHYIVLDEFQDISEITWTKVLRPTLASTGGHAMFLGCVVGETKVLTRGGLKRIEDFSSGEGPKEAGSLDVELYGLNRHFHRTENFWNNGVVKTRILRTKSGFKLESSMPHPIWVMGADGAPCWKTTETIEIGDRVAIARGMEVWGGIDPLAGWDAHISAVRDERAGKQGAQAIRIENNENE